MCFGTYRIRYIVMYCETIRSDAVGVELVLSDKRLTGPHDISYPL